MAKTHNLGFPRIGANRELKFALEAYWRGEHTEADLSHVGETLRKSHWKKQASLDRVPVGDFSFYDQVLDMSVTLGHVPERVKQQGGSELDQYFRAARGRAVANGDHEGTCVHASEMTKWFDTNYHYLVPEFEAGTTFSLNPKRLLDQMAEALDQGHTPKPVVLGPVSYLRLGKAKDDVDPLALLDRLLPCYLELLSTLTAAGADWVQIDEPVLVTDLPDAWRKAVSQSYQTLSQTPARLLLATYFGPLGDNAGLAGSLPVDGLHLDLCHPTPDQARRELEPLLAEWPEHKVLSLGVINGRNIWVTNLAAVLDWLEPIHRQLSDRLWLAPSCSLLHVPVDLASEQQLDPEVASWLAFAVQKLDELQTLARALNHGQGSVEAELAANTRAIESRRRSGRTHNQAVRDAVKNLPAGAGTRHHGYPIRRLRQKERLPLPLFPTTTIGSFPQTGEIRTLRRRFRQGSIDRLGYESALRREIEHTIREQEALGLDVLVHGEAERNDMVEYFGQQLAGFAFTDAGWVQSYGSRCVKPPILYGDVHRPQPMTVQWIRYAQSLTSKPVKGMLTGPVTVLNWSFVRDDQPEADTCQQLAVAIRQEVLDLEAAGVGVIQIDEAALREGLPLRRSDWGPYLDWAISAFRIAANGVRDDTQIHTHMCYSEFNDILEAIADMDADVITIETSRSDMELLDAFDHFRYPNEIGPGVYDIHSPNVPSETQIRRLMERAAERIPAERLWVNPDCGLKTRGWEEVRPALANMVAAARSLRQAEAAG